MVNSQITLLCKSYNHYIMECVKYRSLCPYCCLFENFCLSYINNCRFFCVWGGSIIILPKHIPKHIPKQRMTPYTCGAFSQMNLSHLLPCTWPPHCQNSLNGGPYPTHFTKFGHIRCNEFQPRGCVGILGFYPFSSTNLGFCKRECLMQLPFFLSVGFVREKVRGGGGVDFILSGIPYSILQPFSPLLKKNHSFSHPQILKFNSISTYLLYIITLKAL